MTPVSETTLSDNLGSPTSWSAIDDARPPRVGVPARGRAAKGFVALVFGVVSSCTSLPSVEASMMRQLPTNISTDVQMGAAAARSQPQHRAVVSAKHLLLADRIYEDGRLLQRKAAEADAALIAAMLNTGDDEG